MMKHLLTRCPDCGSRFYEEVQKRGRIQINCPYCGFDFWDEVEDDRIKEAKYRWELYANLYPTLKARHTGDRFVKLGGLLLLLTIPFFAYSLLSGLDGTLSSLSSDNMAYRLGIGLAGFIYSIVIVAGGLSSIKKYSFAISLSGCIFGFISSVIWEMFMIFPSGQVPILGSENQFIFFPILFSLVALVITVHFRRSYHISY